MLCQMTEPDGAKQSPLDFRRLRILHLSHDTKFQQWKGNSVAQAVPALKLSHNLMCTRDT